jgi:pimeloyl-ACP methyl ester carboxylesterase
MMGGYRPVQGRVRAAIEMPLLGPALYRLNVAAPVIAMMYRRHVYSDAVRVTAEFVADKAAVARRAGGRFGSGAFVTGALDVVHDRAGFLALVPDLPLFVIYGANTPAKSRAEMEALARHRGVISFLVPIGSLGLHEERPELLAEPLLGFLRQH